MPTHSPTLGDTTRHPNSADAKDPRWHRTSCRESGDADVVQPRAEERAAIGSTSLASEVADHGWRPRSPRQGLLTEVLQFDRVTGLPSISIREAGERNRSGSANHHRSGTAPFGTSGKPHQDADDKEPRNDHPLERPIVVIGVEAGQRLDPVVPKQRQRCEKSTQRSQRCFEPEPCPNSRHQETPSLEIDGLSAEPKFDFNPARCQEQCKNGLRLPRVLATGAPSPRPPCPTGLLLDLPGVDGDWLDGLLLFAAAPDVGARSSFGLPVSGRTHQFANHLPSTPPARGREMAWLCDGARRARTADLLGAITSNGFAAGRDLALFSHLRRIRVSDRSRLVAVGCHASLTKI